MIKGVTKILKAVHFWTLLPRTKRNYYSFLKATQSNKAVLTGPFEFWFNNLVSEVSEMENHCTHFHSIIHPDSFSDLTRSWKSRLSYYLRALLWSNSSHYLSSTGETRRKLARNSAEEKKILQEKTTCSIWNFLKQRTRGRKKKTCFLIEARKAFILQFVLFIMVHR